MPDYARVHPVCYFTPAAPISLASTGSLTWTPVSTAFEFLYQGSAPITDDGDTSYLHKIYYVATIPAGTFPFNFRWRDTTNSQTILELIVSGQLSSGQYGPLGTLPPGDARFILEYWSTLTVTFHAAFLMARRKV